QAPSASMSIQDSAPTPTNSSNTLISSHNVDEQSQPHAQQQWNHTLLPTTSFTDNVSNAMFKGDLFVNPFTTPSTESITKDHLLEQVIGETSRSVLIRNQLKTDGDMCIYALTVSIMKPKPVKEALTYPAWIESMQEELPQFIRLDALYGLKKVPRAWYDEFSTFLLQNEFSIGIIDLTLFTRHFDDDILVVQVYVDDIILGSTNPRYATLFSDLMKSRFKMLMIGEMMFFLGLQVNQSSGGIFINQSNYVNEILKKYGLNTYDTIGTPMDIKDKLDLDQIRTSVDATKYHSMIGALMYLTSSRPDIVHATCDSGFELTVFSDVDYTGCKDTFKSTSGRAQFLGENPLDADAVNRLWLSLQQDPNLL
nr:hypothetical protein [Tanacetum cinerariifolium]